MNHKKFLREEVLGGIFNVHNFEEQEIFVTHVLYKIVKHADGWAYQVGETFSETYLNHDEAREAARAASREHVLSGNTVGITFEDSNGQWHEELSDGSDRPITSVEG